MVSSTPSDAIAMVRLVREVNAPKRSGSVTTATDLAMAELVRWKEKDLCLLRGLRLVHKLKRLPLRPPHQRRPTLPFGGPQQTGRAPSP
jgi:hypothetical protein